MFKTAVNHWLGKNAKTSGHAGTRGRSAHRGHAVAAAASAGSSESKSLVMAETMMKHELNLSKQPARDTTLSHSSLRTAQKQSAARKQHGLGQLEQAMLKSSMSQARKDGPAIHKQHEMMHKLKEAAREKRHREAASKPSYKTAMNKFTARLMHKEVSARHRFLKPANQQGTVDKRALESAIKKRVAMKLSLGSKKLAQERAALVNQFNSGHSLFAKAERKELKELSGRSSPRQLSAPASLKDSWHL